MRSTTGLILTSILAACGVDVATPHPDINTIGCVCDAKAMDGESCSTGQEVCTCLHGIAWHFCEANPPTSGYGVPPSPRCVVRPTVSSSQAGCEEDICSFYGLRPCRKEFD